MTSLALARDGCSLLVNLQSQTIHLWDLSNPAVPRATAAVAGPSSSVRSLPPHPCRRNSSRVFGLRPRALRGAAQPQNTGVSPLECMLIRSKRAVEESSAPLTAPLVLSVRSEPSCTTFRSGCTTPPSGQPCTQPLSDRGGGGDRCRR